MSCKRIALIFIVIVTISIIVTFFWSIIPFTRIEKVTLVVSFISSIATLSTVFIIYFTLIEMKEQRKSMYLPDVVVVDYVVPAQSYWRHFHTKGVKEEVFLPLFYTEKDGKSTGDPTLKISNIGLGNAKNVIVKWDFDFDFFINNIKQMDTDNLFNFQFKDEYTCVFVLGAAFSTTIKSDINLGYIMPIQMKQGKVIIHMPTNYLLLTSLLLYLLIKQKRSKDLLILLKELIPVLKMEIEYRDLGGNKYFRNYSIYFEIGNFVLLDTPPVVPIDTQPFSGKFMVDEF